MSIYQYSDCGTYQDVAVRSVAVDRGYVTVYMGFADGSGQIEQLSTASGAVIWTQRLPESPVGRIVDADGIIYTYITPIAGCLGSGPTCQNTVLMQRAATGASVGKFSVYGEIFAFTVRDGLAIIDITAPYAITGVPIPGAPRPPVPFTFRPHGIGPFAIGVVTAGEPYTGLDRFGLLSLTSATPVWEADGCGNALAGSATATMRGGTAIWCHWPAGSEVIRAAVQGETA
jgi:hypothetical protein